MQIEIIINGSVGSGKTTLIRNHTEFLKKRGICTCALEMNLCHLICFIFTKFLYLIRYGKKRPIGNYYLTFHYIDRYLFSKVLRIMMILDIFSLILRIFAYKSICKLRCFNKRCIVYIYDEYIPNILIDYLYFKRVYNIKIYYNILYYIFFSYLVKQSRDRTVIILIFIIPVKSSIYSWIIREKTTLVDEEHFLTRITGSIVLGKIMKKFNINVIYIKGENATAVIRQGILFFNSLFNDLDCKL